MPRASLYTSMWWPMPFLEGRWLGIREIRRTNLLRIAGGKLFEERSVPSHLSRDRGLRNTQEWCNRGLRLGVKEESDRILRFERYAVVAFHECFFVWVIKRGAAEPTTARLSDQLHLGRWRLNPRPQDWDARLSVYTVDPTLTKLFFSLRDRFVVKSSGLGS